MILELVVIYIFVVIVLFFYLDSLCHQWNTKFAGHSIVRWTKKYKRMKALAKRIENLALFLETIVPYSNLDGFRPKSKTFLDLLLEND